MSNLNKAEIQSHFGLSVVLFSTPLRAILIHCFQPQQSVCFVFEQWKLLISTASVVSRFTANNVYNIHRPIVLQFIVSKNKVICLDEPATHSCYKCLNEMMASVIT